MSARRLSRMRAALDRRQPDLRVLLDGVHKSHNLSAILRTCDAVGIGRVHAVWPGDRLAVHRNCSAGAGRWVELDVHRRVEEAVAAARAEGLAVYAAHASAQAMDFRSVDWTRPGALLMGAELWGVSEAGAELADAHLAVPMLGLTESLNVSVAAAVVLYEAQRQRQAAGFYERPRLDPQAYRRTLFRWLQPRLARYCDARGLDYPELDADGHVSGWSPVG